MSQNFNSNDPFVVLGLEEPTADKKVIRRAYKRMALKYHPDVATTKDSSAEEKKEASERFAKINWAYETLSGKRKDDTTYGKTTGAAAGASSTTGGWTPPHRRSAGSSYTGSSTTGGAEPSWEDFMPKYDDDAKYDANGDSFEKIFADLFVGAAAGAAGLGGGPNIFKDFVEFLEGNVDMGFGGDDSDSDLRILLAAGNVEEIGNEMDDTELVINQLKSKLDSIKGEIYDRQADLRLSQRYSERYELEENIAELEARKEVVDGYLKKANKRLVKIQTRYKELIVSGQNDNYAGGYSSSSWNDIRNQASGASSSTGRSSYSSSQSGRGGSSTGSSYQQPNSSPSSRSGGNQASSSSSSSSGEDSWMGEGFGSSGQRRGSSRRSRRPSRNSNSRPQEPVNNRPPPASRQEPVRPPPASRQEPASRPPPSTSRTSTTTPTTYTSDNIPPHRRRQSTFQSQQEEKRRLRDLKVDDEFDKLKKELGL